MCKLPAVLIIRPEFTCVSRILHQVISSHNLAGADETLAYTTTVHWPPIVYYEYTLVYTVV